MERNRIARDLHDTFLQSVQALMLQFSALSTQVSGDPRVRAQLDEALDLADKVLDDSAWQYFDGAGWVGDCVSADRSR